MYTYHIKPESSLQLHKYTKCEWATFPLYTHTIETSLKIEDRTLDGSRALIQNIYIF